MKQISFSILLVLFSMSACFAQVAPKTGTDTNGNTYTYYENSPLDCRLYTLSNGLTVFLNRNTDEPIIETYIGIKAGSTYDPEDNTGLAHYLEHLMFKGTDKIGTIDYTKEKPYIDTIADLYEQHKAATDTSKKQRIYAKIDSLSGIAAQYAIPNEYDNLIAAIGAKNTNAYTSRERTVYLNTIPSNELERFLLIEKERFSNLVLRLFHTELEAVYEEFNMGQDDDGRNAYYAFLKAMFPTHPYGSQTTIGKAEHLKNPSMYAIHKYWNTYYCPNNMAISLSGDLDFDTSIALIKATFGTMKKGTLPEISHPKEKPITKPIEKTVYGPNSEFIMMGYRTEGVGSAQEPVLELLNGVLFNNTAGLLDLNLNKKQIVQYATAYTDLNKEYGNLSFYSLPRENQTLEELKDHILEQIDILKKGEFDEWQLDAYINDVKLKRLQSYETNKIAHTFIENFSNNIEWVEYLNYPEKLEKISKNDLIKYAKKNLNDNYVIVYKRTGENKNKIKVNKPKITPIEIDRNKESDFFRTIVSKQTENIKPEFVDFKTAIQSIQINDSIDLKYIKNTDNDLFSLYYVFEMGKHNDSILPLAITYLPYIGTSKYTKEELAIEFYKNGLSYNVHTQDDMTYVSISGLQSSFTKGGELLEHILSDVQPDSVAYLKMIGGIIKERENMKLDKRTILTKALVSYVKYGSKSPFTYNISNDELVEIEPEILTQKIHELCSYKHEVFYYGPIEKEKIVQEVRSFHSPQINKNIPPSREFPYIKLESNVYFVNYDIVQSNILLLKDNGVYSLQDAAKNRVFDEYYGSSMSSIVFQTLREAQGLAYASFAFIKEASEEDEHNFLYAYIGTSPDKISAATSTILNIFKNFTKEDRLFSNAKNTVLKNIQTQRIIKNKIYFQYLKNHKLGFEFDYRKKIYENLQNMTLDDFENYFNTNIKTDTFSYLVVGNKNDIDFSVLEKLGTVKELSLEEIFGY